MEKVVELEIKDLTSSGEGVGKYNGLTIFVDGALINEKVQVALYEEKKNYAKGRLLKILQKAEERVDPICSKFDQCGGCQLMHLSYKGQLAVKENRVKDAFYRIGKLNNFKIAPCQPSPNQLHYRNKIQLPISQGMKMGLYAKGSHEIISIENCLIHNPLGEQIVCAIKKLLATFPISIYDEKRGKGELRHLLVKTAVHNKKAIVVLITTLSPSKILKEIAKKLVKLPNVSGVIHGLNNRKNNVVRADKYKVLEGEYYLNETLLGIQVQISPPSFFQVNSLQAENIYKKAFELAQIKKEDRIVDAYCGIGLFTCFLGKHSEFVTGIEVIKEAIEDAKINARNNNVKVQFICAKVEEEIGKLPRQDVVFLNPPRKGCEKSVLKAVATMNPKKIIYTSCDAATLARDANVLSEMGYSDISLYPFDMFPQTMHVETIAHFTKKS